MNTTTVSPKFQVLIPKEVREQMNIKPGTKYSVVAYDGRLQFVPVKSIKDLRGMARGIDLSFERDPDREF